MKAYEWIDKRSIGDAGLQWICEEAEREVSSNHDLDVEKVRRVKYVHCLLDNILNGNQYDIDNKLGFISENFGVVSIIGKNLEITNPTLFLHAVELADNFEAFPKVNGDVEMNFGFYGILKNNGGVANE